MKSYCGELSRVILIQGRHGNVQTKHCVHAEASKCVNVVS